MATKSDSDVILCLQLLSKTFTYTLPFSLRKSIDHLCVIPFTRIGLIHTWSIDFKSQVTLQSKHDVTVTLGWQDSRWASCTVAIIKFICSKYRQSHVNRKHGIVVCEHYRHRPFYVLAVFSTPLLLVFWDAYIQNPNSRGTKVAYRAKTHILCSRKVYGWNFVYW